MADPLVLSFQAETSKAQAAMASLAASVAGNMASIGVSMLGGAEKTNRMGGTLAGLSNNARRAASAVSSDVKNIFNAVTEAASKDRATVESVTAALISSVATSNTAITGLKTGATGATTTIKTLVQQAPTISTLVAGLLGFVAASAAVDLFTAAATAASEALEGTAKIGSDAARLGTSTTFLQTYLAQARALRVEADDLRKSLDMARAAFTVKQGEGDADARNESEFERRLRQQVSAGNAESGSVERFTRAVGTEAQFRVALDLISEMQAKGRELAALDLASKLFPPEIVDRIRQGTIEIDRLKTTMDDIKNPDLVLLKPEEIARAQELQRRLEDAEAVLARSSAEWNRELARAGERLKEDAILWKEIIAAGSHLLLQTLQAARTTGAAFGREGAGLSPRPAGSLSAQLGGELGAIAPQRQPTQSTEEQRQYEDALNRLRGNLGNRTLIEQAQAASRSLGEGLRRDTTKPIVTATKPAAARSNASDSLDAVETLINRIEKETAALRGETEAYAKSNAEKATAINLAKVEEVAKQQGLSVTDAQIVRIKAASAATAQFKNTLADLEQQERQTAETARYFGEALSEGLADAAFNGAKLTDILSNVSTMLGRSALRALITGEGPLAGLLGTAPAASDRPNATGGLIRLASDGFKGSGIGDFFSSLFRANGGEVQAGRAYTVGEVGREIFVPRENGRVWPVERGALTPSGANRSGSEMRPILVPVTIVANDPVAFRGSEAQVTAALARALQRGTRSL